MNTNVPKKVDILSLKKKQEPVADEQQKEQKEQQAKEAIDKRAEELLERYKPVEEVYQKVGQERADQDKKKQIELDRLNKTSFKTSFNISLRDNDDYEEIRKQTRGVIRLGYRHVFKYGLKQLLKLDREEVIKSILEIDDEYKKMGLSIKE